MKYSNYLKSLCRQVINNCKPDNLEKQKTHEKYLDEFLSLAILDSIRSDPGYASGYNSLEFVVSVQKFAGMSKSQIFQDLWVLWLTKFKRNGFFVEFGAVDGVSFSNTYLLEKEFGWSGILAEPNPDMWEKLCNNRGCAKVEKCVYSESGKTVDFKLTERPELSTISNNSDVFSDVHSDKRNSLKSRIVSVPTISLNDLLLEYHAPHDIDYLSVDTEGSEFEIIRNFDFKKWNISLLTIEHNRTEQEMYLDTIMVNNGYSRMFKGLSLVDAWYVKNDFISEKNYIIPNE